MPEECILVIDASGSTLRMTEDQLRTICALEECASTAAQLIEAGRGKLVKFLGDGALARFKTIQDGFQCTTAFQLAMERRNSRVPPSSRILYRAGIDYGEVQELRGGSDIAGLAVNMAARLQEYAPLGGVCVSRRVRAELARTLPDRFVQVSVDREKYTSEGVEAFVLKGFGSPRALRHSKLVRAVSPGASITRRSLLTTVYRVIAVFVSGPPPALPPSTPSEDAREAFFDLFGPPAPIRGCYTGTHPDNIAADLSLRGAFGMLDAPPQTDSGRMLEPSLRGDIIAFGGPTSTLATMLAWEFEGSDRHTLNRVKNASMPLHYFGMSESLAHQNYQIKQAFEALDALNPADANYQAELEERSSELLKLIPEQNKQDLSRYVIRRQMVAKVLGMIVDEKIVSQPMKSASGKKPRLDREGLIHDLLIKRKAHTGASPNDLWVLNEEFVHFEGCSEMPIDQITDSKGNRLLRSIPADVLKTYGIKPDRRPDIFLYAEESQCILIELKAPDVDLADYLNQLPKYCNLIANFSLKPITRFHCYLIGEALSPIDIGGDYRRNVHGDWVRRSDYPIMRYEDGRQDQEIGKAHIEIIKLSSVHTRALRRNKSFADRLGIGDDALGPS